MSSPWKLVAWVIACLMNIPSASQQFDLPPAARVLGPGWKKIARTAGTVFSGTVLNVEASPANSQALSAIQWKLRVERAIAGVKEGQVVTIREWTGAWSMHRQTHPGEHVLLLLYPPSSLGFTSPVSGALGLIALDASGTMVATSEFRTDSRPVTNARQKSISVAQLLRDIQSAREE